MARREKSGQARGQNQKGKRSLKKNKNNDDGDTGLPTQEDLLKFIQDSGGSLDKRDIARAFGIKGQERTQLRKMLRDLADSGRLSKDRAHAYAAPDRLPETAVVEITGIDGDGELRAKPVEWFGQGPAPVIYITDRKKSGENVE